MTRCVRRIAGAPSAGAIEITEGRRAPGRRLVVAETVVPKTLEAVAKQQLEDEVDPGNALVREVGWQTIDSGGDRAYWERCERPGVQFFRRENPGYEEGHGLLTLVPLTVGTVTRGIARYLYATAGSAVRRWRCGTAS